MIISTVLFIWLLGRKKDMRLLLLSCLVLFWSSHSTAQTTKIHPLQISVFNNATLLPGAARLGVFGWPIHPGIRVGLVFNLQERKQSRWYQTAQLAYHYHRYVHHGIQLYSELGYLYEMSERWDIESRMGLGYLHAIKATPSFQLSDGVYQKQNAWGRAQMTAGASIGIGYRWQLDWRIFIQSQFYIQAPFVREYVPILPNLAFHTGVQVPLTLNR